jgi:beta-aspartyl-dipeptidase (metallo-type)
MVAGGKVIAIADKITKPANIETEIISCDGLRMIPGIIDCHAHIAGAGGEGGPATRTPEMHLSEIIRGGITTVIGCLGTDGITRTVESVLMKAKALRKEGISCWIYTGAYQVPTPTILGDVAKDIALIEEVIGVGEIAISDHRSSGPTVDQIINLAGHARVGGMLGGKAGIVNFHMGDAKNPFGILYEAVEKSELKLTQFLPTHINRNDYIFEDSKEYGKQGYIDITSSSYPFFPEYETKPSKAIAELVKAGVPLEHITMSSDGGGSLPSFDSEGRLEKLVTGDTRSILEEITAVSREEGMEFEKALCVSTSNPARILGLNTKGIIAEGMDADLVLLDPEDRVYHLTAMGCFMIKDAKSIKKGTFE